MTVTGRAAAVGFIPVLVIAIILGVYLSQSATVVSSSTASTVSRSSSTTSAVSANEQPFPNVKKTFGYDHIPYEFTIGNFTIHLANNGTFYVTPPVNGTSTAYNGWVFGFNVSTPDGVTKYPFFLWAPPCSLNVGLPCQKDNSFDLPGPENATIAYGSTANLLILWNANTSGLYVSFIQFEQVPVVGPPPAQYVAGSCPAANETYPNTMTPWSSSTSNKVVEITNLTIFWLGPASDLDGNQSQPSLNLSLRAGQVLFYDVPWSAQPFDYKIESVFTNTTDFAVLGICRGSMVTLPQQVIEGTNFGFMILLQLPSNSSYTGPVNIYVETGEKTPGCQNCNNTA